MRLFFLILFTCKAIFASDVYLIKLDTKAKTVSICKSLKQKTEPAERCSIIKQHRLRRSCEIKEALDYLRESGYYHFKSSI